MNDFPELSENLLWLTPQGMISHDVNPVPYADWLEFGAKLFIVRQAIQWAIGDWINYGEAHYGEKYAQALDATEYDYSTLSKYAMLSQRFEFFRRRKNLSWSHHMEVVSLKSEDEQDALLDIAESQQMGRDELRDVVKKYKAEDSRPQPIGDADNSIGATLETNNSALSALVLEAENEVAEEETSDDMPSPVRVRLIVGRAEDMSAIADASVDLIITSPPYNLGGEHWPMGGQGRTTRAGIGYQDSVPEGEYQNWQIACLNEMYRVAKEGATLFYNHKPRTNNGNCVHPVQWLAHPRNQWAFRQEIIWDRKSTHNHSETLFDPVDERIYWLTKGKPTLGVYGIKQSTIWREFGPVSNTWHPAPFTEALPEMLIKAIGRDGKLTVLDPFAGSCTTLRVALKFGYDVIGVDIDESYLAKAAEVNEWETVNNI